MTTRRATLIAVSVIAGFYALSAWAVAVGEGDSAVVDRSREFGPDLMFLFLDERGPAWLVDVSALLFITSLLAALIAFHNAMARYLLLTGPRRGVASDPGADESTHAGSGCRLAREGAVALVVLMALTSFAVVRYFRCQPHGLGAWTRVVAPVVAGVVLTALFGAIVANFDVLIGFEGASVLSWMLSAVVVVPGVAAFAWTFRLRTANPAVYARVGRGGETG